MSVRASNRRISTDPLRPFSLSRSGQGVFLARSSLGEQCRMAENRGCTYTTHSAQTRTPLDLETLHCPRSGERCRLTAGLCVAARIWE